MEPPPKKIYFMFIVEVGSEGGLSDVFVDFFSPMHVEYLKHIGVIYNTHTQVCLT